MPAPENMAVRSTTALNPLFWVVEHRSLVC